MCKVDLQLYHCQPSPHGARASDGHTYCHKCVVKHVAVAQVFVAWEGISNLPLTCGEPVHSGSGKLHISQWRGRGRMEQRQGGGVMGWGKLGRRAEGGPRRDQQGFPPFHHHHILSPIPGLISHHDAAWTSTMILLLQAQVTHVAAGLNHSKIMHIPLTRGDLQQPLSPCWCSRGCSTAAS